jgi:hypothetical protein
LTLVKLKKHSKTFNKLLKNRLYSDRYLKKF